MIDQGSLDPAMQMTLREVFDRFYREMHPNSSNNTLSDYRTALKHWERYTSNPTMGQLASEKPQDKRMFRIMLQRYHSDLQDFGIARVTTANKYLRSILAVLNMAGPNMKGNPNGLDILGWIPSIKQAEEPEPEPRQLNDATIDAIYQACGVANWPALPGVEPCDWWRALLVFLTFVGYRRGDWWNSLRWSDVNLDEGWVEKLESKTRKRERKALFDCVVWHLRKMQTKREFVFQSHKSKKRLYPQWNAIQREAGIAEPFYRFKDLRSTCGDKYYAEAPSLGQIVLSHSSQKITERHYANTKQRKYEALAAAEDKISIPSAFLPKLKILHDDAC